MKGSEFGQSILKVEGKLRESAVLQAFQGGSMPGWLLVQPWREVSVEADIKGVTRRLIYFVAPDYFSIGTDEDFLRVPARPDTYQTIASALHCILPSRRMVDAIWGTARVQGSSVPPSPLPPNKGADRKDSEPFLVINKIIDDQLRKLGKWPTNSLIAGDKKDVVVGPDLDGTHVAIYGWHQANGKPIQGYPGPHIIDHVDYSHGLRLVSRAALLDAVPIDIASVFTDKDLHVLVSDQGPFPPFFPNAHEKNAMALERALGIGRTVSDVTATKPVKVETVNEPKWGTLQYLIALSASISVGSFVYDRFIKKDDRAARR
jgi:hypothetical protein